MKAVRLISLFTILILSYALGWLDEYFQTLFTRPGFGLQAFWPMAASNLVFAISMAYLTWLYLRSPAPESWLSVTCCLAGLAVMLIASPLAIYLRGALDLLPQRTYLWWAFDKFPLAGAFALVIGVWGLIRRRSVGANLPGQ